MNIWEVDKVLLFLTLVLPGFISLKMYSMVVAAENRDYSKSIVEAVCYSVLNFSVFSWILLTISQDGFVKDHPVFYWLAILLIFILAPSFWPFIFLWLSKKKFIKKRILSPYKQPWDYVFTKRESYWVAIHLKNGEIVRGKYALKSFASSYPSERQIYLEEYWVESDEQMFARKGNRTKGVLISQEEISYIKFYGK